MEFAKIKDLYEKIPVKVKFVFSPLFVKILVDNPVFKKTVEEIEKFEAMDIAAQEEVQFKKLKETLVYAAKNVPYYKKLFQQIGFNPNEMNTFDEIKIIPLLTKEQVIKIGEDLYSNDNIECYTVYTGGSSGQSMKCLLDKESYYKERAFYAQFLAPLGYDPKKSRTVSFYGHNKGGDYYFSPIKADIVISPFRLFKEESFEDIYKLIVAFKPDFLMCYASAITYFAKQCKKKGKSISLKGVVFTSENWCEKDRELVEDVFHCQAISIYGHTERAVFASVNDEECLFNRLYGYTELIPTEIQNEFQIACTGFISRKMPLIRYLTDDVIQVAEDGKQKLIGHRKSDVRLIGKNGVSIFKGALTLHLAETKKIRACQFVQNEVGKAQLNIVEDEALTGSELGKIREYLELRCEGLLDIEIQIVPEVKRTPRGKYIWAICNVGKDEEQVK